MKLRLKQTNDSKIYFTSDTHINHKNLCGGISKWVKPEKWPIPYNQWTNNEQRIKFCKENGVRDFTSIEKMNSTIIDNFNGIVGQNDILFMLGDVVFGGPEILRKFMGQLICKNVYLIFGNHDREIEDNHGGIQGFFKSCDYYKEIFVDNQMIVLSHYSHRVWNKHHKGSYMLYGHSHDHLEPKLWGKSMDVGVDTNNMEPYSFDEIKRILDKQEILKIDHHNGRDKE